MLHHQKETPATIAASKMPPLCHWPNDGRGFDIMRSEVVEWLCQQPEIRQMVFNIMKRSAITYDLETRTWRGVAYGKK